MYEYNAKVVSVYDGDTVTLDIDLGCFTWIASEKCRLFGIDTPELRGSDEEKKAGRAARDYLRNLIPLGSTIRIKTQLDKTGKYGRLLVNIFVHFSELADYVPLAHLKLLRDQESGLVDINNLLVVEGYAEARLY